MRPPESTREVRLSIKEQLGTNVYTTCKVLCHPFEKGGERPPNGMDGRLLTGETQYVPSAYALASANLKDMLHEANALRGGEKCCRDLRRGA